MKNPILANIKRNWILLLILSGGFVLRLIGLSTKSIWYDEACSVCFCQKSWGEIFPHRYFLRPLYFVFLKLWTGVFGYKQFVLRFPSVIFGACSILMIYFIARELFNKKTGLLAAFLLSISGYHIIRSQDARGYTLLMFLVCLAIIPFWNIIKYKKQQYGYYAAVIIAIFLTNFFAGLVIFITLNLVYLINEQERKRWISWQLFILFVSAALLLPFAGFYYLEKYNDRFSCPEYSTVFPHMLEDFAYARKINQGGVGNYGLENISMLRKADYYIILGIFIYGLAGFFLGNRGARKQISRKTVFVLLWFFVPVVLFLGANIFIPIAKWSKSAIIILPAFYILISLGSSSLSKKTLIVYLSVYTFFSAGSLGYIYSASQVSSWEQAAAIVKQNIKPEEVILFAPAHFIAPFWYYYKQGDNAGLKPIDDGDYGHFYKANGQWRMEFNDNTNLIKGLSFEQADKINKGEVFLKQQYKGIWLVTGPWFGEKNMAILVSRLSQDYQLEFSKQFPWQPAVLYHFSLKQRLAR